jgi:hypothetical protein
VGSARGAASKVGGRWISSRINQQSRQKFTRNPHRERGYRCSALVEGGRYLATSFNVLRGLAERLVPAEIFEEIKVPRCRVQVALCEHSANQVAVMLLAWRKFGLGRWDALEIQTHVVFLHDQRHDILFLLLVAPADVNFGKVLALVVETIAGTLANHVVVVCDDLGMMVVVVFIFFFILNILFAYSYRVESFVELEQLWALLQGIVQTRLDAIAAVRNLNSELIYHGSVVVQCENVSLKVIVLVEAVALLQVAFEVLLVINWRREEEMNLNYLKITVILKITKFSQLSNSAI